MPSWMAFRALSTARTSCAETNLQCTGTLLRNLADGRFSPFPRQIYPTAFVTGMPRAV